MSEILENKAKVYVGCSLTHAPQEFKDSVQNFKDGLSDEGYQVLDFVGLTAGTSKDVYEWDIQHCVDSCDVFVGICDEPSIGLGCELERARQRGIGVLALAHTDARVTRLIFGMAEVEPNVRFERYDQLSEAIPMVAELLQ